MNDSTQPHDEAPQPSMEKAAAQQAATQRAEEMVDRAGERVGYFASMATQRVRVAAARAREEVEDMWAEAQSVRRGKGS